MIKFFGLLSNKKKIKIDVVITIYVAALGSVLLFVMLVFYWFYNKIIGVENIKLG